MKKVSVAITTYNGEKYIEELLNSIMQQSRKADEVIIADDGSSDGTIQIVEHFIKHHNLDGEWFFYKNEKNLGFANNFFSCMAKTTGDLIFLCDQDDVWHINKIEAMEEIFLNKTGVKALLCKENKIDENGDYIAKYEKSTGDVKKIDFVKEIKMCLGAGHLLAITRDFYIENARNLQKEKLTFDVPFCIIASVVDGLYQIDLRLVDRRIHKNNTSGIGVSKIPIMKDKKRYIKGRKCRLGYYEYIEKYFFEEIPENKKKEYLDAIKLLTDSVEALEKRKMVPLFKELFSLNCFINKKISLANFFVFSSK